MKTAGVVGLVLAGAVGFAAVAAAGLGFAIARRLTAPLSGRVYDLKVRDVVSVDGHPTVVLDKTPRTTAPGLYNLWVEGGGWVKLGAVLDTAETTVTRVVQSENPAGVLRPGQRVSWSGIYFQDPDDAGLDAEDVLIDTPVGPAPAWLIPPTGEVREGDWAIHIHGLGSPRAGTLRGVRVAARAGLTSLVVTYRNDGEGPTVGSGRSMLGVTETEDVRAAAQYAIAQGAQRIVLVGWSMGAVVALELAAGATPLDAIVGLVLDSPVLDWKATIAANCSRTGLPAWAGTLAHPWLRGPTARVDWLDRADDISKPIVMLHGSADRSTPFFISAQLQRLRPDVAELRGFDSDHTLTWNRDDETWERVVGQWLAGRGTVARTLG